MKALATTEGNVQIAWTAPRCASSGLTGPPIIAGSESGHAGEVEFADLERGDDAGHEGAVGELLHRGPPDSITAANVGWVRLVSVEGARILSNPPWHRQ